jgi:hypothetical protein
MSRRHVWLLGLGLVLPLAAATVLCQADEPKKDPDKKGLTAEERDRALEEIALAYQIADAGRKAGSPEALLAAAKIFSRLGSKEIGLVKLEGVKSVKGKKGETTKFKLPEPVKEEGGKPVSFVAEIQKLQEDARKLNTPRDDSLAALIDKVDKPRGSVDGPKWFVQDEGIKGGYFVYQFTFRGGEPARVLLRNKNGQPYRLAIYRGESIDEGNIDGYPSVVLGSDRFPRFRTVEGSGDLQVIWTPKVTRPFIIYAEHLGDGDRAAIDLFKN